MRSTRFLFGLAVLAVLVPGLYGQVSPTSPAGWAAIGPDGGDARRFAFDPRDPQRIYLGTTDSWIYQSTDGGSSWSRLAKLGSQDNLVIDSLAVDRSDPRTLFAGVWVMDHPDGGVYISHDGGRSWAESRGMDGQSVLALAQARSNPDELVAGTLRGVYRSLDKGLHWREISPPFSAEIHEVESIAIDPYDAGIIYAGTWHLPWKTMDGGTTWRSMKQGLIVDSDIFSMIVDPSRPSVVYLSACSGIYRSDDFGDDFRKVQGIPSSARRTRVITMDPSDRDIVYAGTTEGLYKTRDGGKNWTRTTGSQVIVNDVYIDPRNPQHVLLATDRSGVLASEDGGLTFQSSNTGFSQRQVAALLVDAKNPGTLYAGVINGKTYGGVFVTTDFGRTWRQQSDGLDGRDVFMLAQGADGALLAGTSDGVFRWDGSAWTPSNTVGVPGSATAPPVSSTRRRDRREERRSARRTDDPSLRGRVTALAVSAGTWFAATPQGVFRSADGGQSWQGPVLGDPNAGFFSGVGDYVAITSSGSAVYAARRNGIVTSVDGGVQWEPVIFPSGLTAVEAMAASPDGTLWAGGREGLFFTTDRGRTWTKLSRLPLVAINSLAWDPSMRRVIVTSRESTVIFAIDPRDRTWKWWNAGWNVHSVAWSGGRLMAASLFSGIVAQPALETASAGGNMAQNAQR
ncbi:MAG: transcriptional regulator [Acidobacteriaceae bacterium]